MLKTIGFACCVAMSHALKLEVESLKVRGLTDMSGWTANEAALLAILNDASITQYSDPVFPAGPESIGGKVADTARGAAGSSNQGPTWVRLSEMMKDVPTMTLFAGKEQFSTATQGQIGDCYLIAALAAFDSRPGALESLFVNKDVNTKGAYGFRLWIQGEQKVVVVDDKVPAVKKRKWNNSTFQWEDSWVPLYAGSRIPGEIWPMIAEKAYAKAAGTYGAIGNGGHVGNVLSQLSDDPFEIITIRRGLSSYGYTTTSAKGNALWADLMKWNRKEYMLFGGADTFSWVKGAHAYSIVWAKEFNFDGKVQRWVQLRNPWGVHKWDGAVWSLDKAAYAKYEPKVKASAGFTQPPGSFQMPWLDFLRQIDELSVAKGQYKKDGSKQKAEYRATVKVPTAASAKAKAPFSLRITLLEDINLKEDWLNIVTMQGGNRGITMRNNNSAKGQTGTAKYGLFNVDNQKLFSREWNGHLVHGRSWIQGDAGNNHMIDDHDKAAVMPKGVYILAVTPTWTQFSDANPVLKELTMRIGSAAKLTADYLTEEQATRLRSDGWAKLATSQKVHCRVTRQDQYQKRGSTLAELCAAARAKQAKYIWASVISTRMDPYLCLETPSTPNSEWWHSWYNTFEVLSTANPLPAFAGSPGVVTPPAAIVTPSNLVPVKKAAAAKKPDAKKPAGSTGWKTDDKNYDQMVKRCENQAWSDFGILKYRQLTIVLPDSSGAQVLYFCESNMNNSGSTKKFTYNFTDDWKVISQNTQTPSAVLKNGETITNVAKATNAGVTFDWSLYQFNAQSP